MISASHNPFQDNGIKFFDARGCKLPDAWEQEVEAALAEAPVWVDAANLGKSRRLDDAAGRYVEFCKSTFPNDLTLRGLKIVVDAAHGAAYQIAPMVFHELGAEVVSIGCAPDGLNINHHVGATHPQALVEAVKAHKADLGVALDGDADRLQVVDGNGRLFNGDELLYLIVDERLFHEASKGRQPGPELGGVVGTLMTNMAIELAFQARGLEFVRANVGDRYVLEALDARGWVLGGEGSGHLITLDKHTTGDGIVAALQVLSSVVRRNSSVASMLAGVVLFPQTLLNVRLKPGQDWKSNANLHREIAVVESELAGCGRVLVRASGTEPLLRLMVEASDATVARVMAQRLADALAM